MEAEQAEAEPNVPNNPAKPTRKIAKPPQQLRRSARIAGKEPAHAQRTPKDQRIFQRTAKYKNQRIFKQPSSNQPKVETVADDDPVDLEYNEKEAQIWPNLSPR